MKAVERCDRASIETLLSQGVDINMADDDGRTPPMYALVPLESDPDPEFIAWLMQIGADVDKQDSGNGWTSLHFAVSTGEAGLVELLLTADAGIEVENKFGNTPLWRATMSTRPAVDVIKLLLAHGANPDHQNKSGISPRDLAKQFGRIEVLTLIG